MDYTRNNPGAIGRNNPKPDPPFHRAYKACIPCRNKKAKCSITAEDYAAGLPCAKCRREMRHCAFTTERHGPGPRRRGDYKGRGEPKRMMETSLNGQSSLESMRTLSPGSNPPPSTAEHNSAPMESHLSDTVMTTMVSNGNDALNLLFEAAQHDGLNVNSGGETEVTNQTSGFSIASSTSPAMTASVSTLPELPPELSDIWNAYRFVRMGWLSAEEAVWFVDIFFENMAPLSPVLDEFYAKHTNHYFLVTQEPMLTCMILTISSRYHTLPAIGGQSRGYSIHQRLWEHCQHLLMRVVLGLEKSSKAKTRTLGTIEALLLLTEWHPRALHAPPPNDGWDSDILFTASDKRDQNGNSVDNPSRTRWREDVIEPAKRSDRLCWMVLGCAMSLANELGLFDEQDEGDSDCVAQHERRTHERKKCLSKLVFVYQEQLSSRLGRKSMIPQSASHCISCADVSSKIGSQRFREWASFMNAWTRLTKVIRSISDLLFPSAAITGQIIQSGRYIGMIEHVQSLLSTWSRDHSSALSQKTYLYDILMLEYQSTRIHIYSLGLQAVVSRTLAESNTNASQSTCFNLTPTDYLHLQEVIDGSLATLKVAVKLSNNQVLRFCPIKVFLHITTASIFLLKGLSMGVSPTKLRDALEVLKAVISALRGSNPDDLHLGARYATLLEVHLARLQEKFVPSLKPPDVISRIERQTQMTANVGGDAGWQFDFVDNVGMTSTESLEDDWLSLPLDASLVPFEMGNFQGLQCLGDGTLDFLWNLGA